MSTGKNADMDKMSIDKKRLLTRKTVDKSTKVRREKTLYLFTRELV